MKDYERFITAYQNDTSLYDYDPRPTESSEAKIKARNEHWAAYSNLFQIASDPVVRAASDFHNFWWEYDPTDEKQFKQFSALYAKMIMAMREDVSERTELSWRRWNTAYRSCSPSNKAQRAKLREASRRSRSRLATDPRERTVSPSRRAG